MQRPAHYKTKSGNAIISYLETVKDSYVTAAQIVRHLQAELGAVSRPTVYRQLEKMVSEGMVRKYFFDGSSVACFQYVDPNGQEQDLYHLKCEVCNNVFDFECDEVTDISRHISQAHAFQVNDSKTVFYGKCEMCMHK